MSKFLPRKIPGGQQITSREYNALLDYVGQLRNINVGPGLNVRLAGSGLMLSLSPVTNDLSDTGEEALYSDATNVGATIAAVAGLVTVTADVGGGALVDRDGNEINFGSYATDGDQYKMDLKLNGKPLTQIDAAIGLAPGRWEWGVDTTVGAENFVAQIGTAADTHDYLVTVRGVKA